MRMTDADQPLSPWDIAQRAPAGVFDGSVSWNSYSGVGALAGSITRRFMSSVRHLSGCSMRLCREAEMAAEPRGRSR
jgi:hypothetical protein